MSGMFPGLPLEVSTDGGDTWADYRPGVTFPDATELTLVTRSAPRFLI